ncbi:hypothetical protein [Sphingobacterium sp.]|uniref:hypothetical protein n=1 Tax=Sphingobacterium sp. TaxID=341027 RepID=UPI0038B65C82
MSRERKVYTKEFKLMSVELSNTLSYLSALARELDIAQHYWWRKEHRVKQGISFSWEWKGYPD